MSLQATYICKYVWVKGRLNLRQVTPNYIYLNENPSVPFPLACCYGKRVDERATEEEGMQEIC